MLAVERLKFPSFGDDELAEIFEPLKALPSLAVAVSGGADSMALMLMLVAWRQLIGDNAPELCVLSVDHGLRREAAEEVHLVAEISRQYGLTHKAFGWSGTSFDGNTQANARNARYDLMCQWCAQQQISHLLVAHTLDDQAETILLRLARGSGVDGLSAMATSRTWETTVIYRPLLSVERARLLQLVEDVKCPYVSDPSNHDLKYDRVRFRQALAVLGPLGVDAHGLVETATRLAHAREALDAMCVQAIGQTVEIFSAGYCIFEPKQLEQYPYEIKRRVLGRLLRAIAGRPYSPAHSSLAQLLAWLQVSDKTTRTLGGCLLMVRENKIWIMRETGRTALAKISLHPGQSLVWDNRIRVSLSASAENSTVVKALGVDNYARIKPLLKSNLNYPSALAAGLPSFWHSDALCAVPHLNFYEENYVCQIEADFANSGQLTEV